MNKLWIFGDSFSVPFWTVGDTSWRADYVKWKGYIPKSYPELLADTLNLKCINLAKSGSDNYTILDSIIPYLNAIKQTDIIIVGWSNTLRFRVANKTNTFTTIHPKALDNIFEQNSTQQIFELSNSTITEFSINRDNAVYIDELNNYIKLLNFTFSNNIIIHWSPFELDKYGLLTTTPSLSNLETTSQETNKIVKDNHFSENAHKLIANQLIDVITNFKVNGFKKIIV